ncbi:hypothetical protein PHILAsVB114_06625 [Candidatus Planktophila limnetica]|uniref:Glycosyltransferase n=1 Tax=Candidatus Planktophila limnetica TaxID=573600 RepID=A0A249LGL1_9ACTN|nr:hypothetical protein [Candidatus Planktophila limnetica]ASY28268.1 hypothetical protein PHILAsVB114_06625 [Candidatus Planktophila limnetica]
MSKPFSIISYAIREADGIDKLIDFLDSLVKFEVSTRTDVVIALKESSEKFHKEVQQLVHQTQIPQIKIIFVPSGGYDIGTHHFIAINSNCEVLILMTASSKPNIKNWDALLLKKFEESQVGIVGSMYSKESIKTSYFEALDLILKSKLHIELKEKDKITAEIRGIKLKIRKISISEKILSKNLLTIARNLVIYAKRDTEPFNYVNFFPEFPNPHLRTTGIAIRRKLLIAIIDDIPTVKSDAFRYESGYQSITRRALSLGWRVLVLSADQNYFDFGDKDIKSTFRVPRVDSIVTDHESRSFHKLNLRMQKVLSKITHG